MIPASGSSAARPRSEKTAKSKAAHIGERFSSWRDLHLYSFVSSVGRVGRRPFASAMTVSVMAIALALPLCLAIVVSAISEATGGFRASRDISLFLRPELTPADVQLAYERISQLRQIERAQLQTPEEGLLEFRRMGGLAEAADLLDANPLPAVVIVEPNLSADPSELAIELESLPEVDLVQHDAAWRARLGAWLKFGERLTLVVSVLLGAGTLLVVGNTIRLDIQGRAEEIRTVQLLGASDGFIRRPFLYLGALYGGLSGVLAVSLAALAMSAMEEPVGSLVATYGSDLKMPGTDLRTWATACGAGLLLGWSGAWLASSHHLRQASAEESR